MHDVTQTDLLSFHRQLIAAEMAGLPVFVSHQESESPLAEQLAIIENRLAQAVGGGVPLGEAIANDEKLSSTYRSAVYLWAGCDRDPAALDGILSTVSANVNVQRNRQLALVQPIVLFVLCTIALVYVCFVTAPRVDALGSQVEKPPGAVLHVLLAMRASIWIWAPLVAGLAGAAVWWWFRLPATSGSRPTQSTKHAYYRSRQTADFCDRLAVLMRHEQPLEQALFMAGTEAVSLDSSESPRASDPLTTTTAESSGQTSIAFAPSTWPPLLNWALSHEHREERIASLEFAATSYRRIAELYAHRFRNWFAPLLLALIGGVLVLMVALAVFGPMIDLLISVAGQD